jgi:hypothetical protein
MDIFSAYLGKLVFTRIETLGEYTIYGARISAMLGGDLQRYILLFVPNAYARSEKAYIHELKWKNLQTRTLRNSYSLPKQSWFPPKSPDFLLEIVDRTEQHSVFGNKDFPYDVKILHDSKKRTIYQYQSRMSFSAILLTYNAIITAKEPDYWGLHVGAPTQLSPDDMIEWL